MYALVKQIQNVGTILNGSTMENQTEVSNTEPLYTITLFNGETQFYDKDGVGYAPSYLRQWTASEKKDHGIYEVVYGAIADVRFYNIVENAPTFANDIVTVTYTSTAKDLEDGEPDQFTGRSSPGLKTQWISQFKDSTNKLLASSDWMIIRKLERDIDVPASVSSYRSAVIAESNRLETAINAATDVEELITAVNSANWPEQE